MRTIKFRVWANNKMYYTIAHRNGRGFGTLVFKFDTEMYSDNYILMQFTGLQDSKGKDIYEGDIIKVSNDKKGMVEFKDGCFQNSKSGWGLHTYLSMPDPYPNEEIEIIGNIHENSKLFK